MPEPRDDGVRLHEDDRHWVQMRENHTESNRSATVRRRCGRRTVLAITERINEELQPELSSDELGFRVVAVRLRIA